MKRAFLLLAVLTTVSGVCGAPAAQRLERGFASPPDSARPWVNWFWLNGNISSNGLTADLEAMKRVGIGGVMLMDVEQGTPPGPARFGSPEWLGLFQHMCVEARRLGLQIDMHNADGWCGSGGPWVTPELSMQTVVWSETTLHGPGETIKTLPRPRTATEHYRDLAVFAFPTLAGEDLKMEDHLPKVTGSPGIETVGPLQRISLPRPESGRPTYLQLEFSQPYTARSLKFVLPLGNGEVCHAELQVSADGVDFKPVRLLEIEHLKEWYGFPETTARFYRVVFFDAEPSLKKLELSNLELTPRFRIEEFESKALFVRRWEGEKRALPTGFVPALAIRRDALLDLSAKLGPEGQLKWKVPAGSWTVLRFGYASNGLTNHPAQPEGTGLECDKLSKDGVEAVFNGLMKKLVASTKGITPNPLVSVHVDSWEVGAQNWTPKFREEFKRRRGYDPLPWLPVMTGRVIQSLDISERFLWDLRQTVSELLAENYAGHLRQLANQRGMRLSIEAYGENPSDDLTYAGRADEPMAELWSWYPYTLAATCTEMASVAHVYGKPIVSMEAFTAVAAEKWQAHPFGVKVYGDFAFCAGINKLVIHRYAHQPWTVPERAPGMCMGPWGLHYERTQTWWEQSRDWHRYLARCQFMLQQGTCVADLCYLASEDAPRMWLAPLKSREARPYNFDACPAEVVLTRMTVREGKLVLPDGMSYRVLLLPDSRTMTPRLLRKLNDLVKAGATVVGRPPERSPSLAGYPDCDTELRRLCAELWGNCDGRTVTEHRFGKGRVVWGPTPEQLLAREGVPPDFRSAVPEHATSVPKHSKRGAESSAVLRYTHRRVGDTHVYFVANKFLEPVEAVCAFRAEGPAPEFWWPDTGRIERAAVYSVTNGTTGLPLRLEPAGSVFVLFRPGANKESITAVTRNGEPVLTTAGMSPAAERFSPGTDATNTFTMAGWVKPAMEIDLPAETDTGVGTFNVIRNDALYPPPGDEVYGDPRHAGTGFSVGVNGVCVLEHSANYFASPLVCPGVLTNWTYVAVVYRERTPELYLNGRFVRSGIRSSYQVHPGVDVQHRRGVAPFRGTVGELQAWTRALTDAEIREEMNSTAVPRVVPARPAAEVIHTGDGALGLRVWQAGEYAAYTGHGQKWQCSAGELPVPHDISGPWQLRFVRPGGVPAEVILEPLGSWSDHPDPDLRHFSGTAAYTKVFDMPADLLAKEQRVFLDLGEVQIMAEVALNGRSLGTLWKPPFRLDITEAARPGSNTLEIRVVNLWPNRMVGDEELPEDSDRKPNGTLREWPSWLGAGLPSPTGRQTFATWRLWKKGDPLLSSGLLGPVRILSVREITIQN